jgi:uncharacterized protein YcfJ
MRKVVLAVVALAVLAIGSTALAGSTDVKVTGTGFAPAAVAVQSGDTVNWPQQLRRPVAPFIRTRPVRPGPEIPVSRD